MFKLPNTISISARLIGAVFLSIFTITIIFFSFDAVRSRQELLHLEQQTISTIVPVLAEMVEHSMLENKQDHIDAVFERLRHSRSVNTVDLLDSKKRIIRTRDFKEGQKPKHLPMQPIHDDIVHVDLPLFKKPECVRCHQNSNDIIGYIRLITPFQKTHEAIFKHNRSHFLLGTVSLVILGVISLLAMRSIIIAPIHQIMNAMINVKNGDLKTRLPSGMNGEFALIANGFNSMVEKLDQEHQEIIEIHRRQVSHMDRLVSLGELAANFAHEVRNPLTGISMAIQILRQSLPQENTNHEILKKILDQVDRLNRTMDNFLNFARMPQTENRPFNIKEPLQKVLFLLEPRARSQKVILIQKIADDLPIINGDPGQLEQVFLNIGLNALQAMPSGGELEITAQQESGGDLLIEIRDSGNGIAPDLLEKVFQPFFTSKPKGSGLGLSIAKQIIEAHQGDIWIESIEHQGTTVYARLPIRQPGRKS